MSEEPAESNASQGAAPNASQGAAPNASQGAGPNASQGAGPSQELTVYLLKLLDATDEELAGPLKEFADQFVEEFEKNTLDAIKNLNYKLCAGCEAIIARPRPFCPHCKAYRFGNL